MADTSLKGRRDDAIPLRVEAEAREQIPPVQLEGPEVIDLRPYLSILWAHRVVLGVSVLSAVGMTVLITTLILPKSYRAMAIVRPVPKAATAGRIVGMLGGGGSGG